MPVNKELITKIVAFVLALVVVFFVGWKLYFFFNPPEEVTPMTQHQAESVGGVQQAANNADIKLDKEQAKEVVHDVKYIYETKTEPVYIVQTTGDKAKETVDKEREAIGADFAIVTDKNDPDKAVDIEKLDADDKVELNQYNINAYKKVIRQLEVGRSGDGDTVVGASISKKINDSGQYIGVGADYDTDEHKTMVKVIYSW